MSEDGLGYQGLKSRRMWNLFAQKSTPLQYDLRMFYASYARKKIVISRLSPEALWLK